MVPADSRRIPRAPRYSGYYYASTTFEYNAIETGVNVLTALDTARALVTSLENRAKELTLVDIATVKNA